MAGGPQDGGFEANPFSTDAGANPYAPTSNVSAAEMAASDVEAYRKMYLSHEASVKSIGVLYMLGAIFMVPIGLVLFGIAIFGGGDMDGVGQGIFAGLGAMYAALGVLQGFVAMGLRRLENWAKIVATVFSVIGLIGFPVGTLISAYFLYLLLSEKGKIVFSDHYKTVIQQTPHIKYKTSIIVWIFLGLLLFLIGLGVVAAVAGA